MAEIGSVIDGKYEVLKEIGHGGMSVVYLAMDNRLNKQWAIKEIKKNGKGKNDEIVVNSLLAEANMMKKLDHPALPRIVDIIDNGITIYVIMDYIEGESLDKVLKEYGAQPEELVIGWAKQLCDALSYLHNQKPPVIYRDMKPANVMLKPEGNIKIIDFGIAREYKEQSLADTTVLGTKGYAPPEQYSGQTDARSDIYALGMTMHHLLTGKDPRAAEAYAPVRMYNPELSEGVESIIDKCVQPARENRYQTCEDLLYDLEHPDLITKDYKRQQKKKMNMFIASASAAAVFLASGIICNIAATSINNGTYETLISSSGASSIESKIENYKEAISIYPDKTDAYMKMLNAFEDEGQFSKKENDQFLAEFNKNQEKFNKSSKEVAELYYKTGLMYFNYYTDQVSGGYNFSTRVQKAHDFFAANYENKNISNDFDQKGLSDCYYHICSFYKKYILSTASVEEASKQDYEALFETMNNTLDTVSNIGAGAYDKLMLDNSIFMFLYDQRSNMQQVNIEKDQILDLMDKVYKDASGLSVNKAQSETLQLEILDSYKDYKEAVERTYQNAEKRYE